VANQYRRTWATPERSDPAPVRAAGAPARLYHDDHQPTGLRWGCPTRGDPGTGQCGHVSIGDISLRTGAALDFANAAVNLHQKLNERGRRILLGRLRDGLNNGFAGLFLEIDTAVQLVKGGYQVRYPDFDGSGSHDLDAVRGNVSMAIECKGISADAGRKIHRRDFYRFMELVGAGNCVTLCDLGILVDQATEPVPTQNPDVRA
jgi:hypothetical protein